MFPKERPMNAFEIQIRVEILICMDTRAERSVFSCICFVKGVGAGD